MSDNAHALTTRAPRVQIWTWLRERLAEAGRLWCQAMHDAREIDEYHLGPTYRCMRCSRRFPNPLHAERPYYRRTQ